MSKEVGNNRYNDGNTGLLSKWGILALGVGGCIGSGVITLLGYAIGMTGHSAWLAFLLALIMGSIVCIPICFVSSSVCLYGGPYALISTMLGKKLAGIYIVAYFLFFPSSVLYGLATAEYLHSLIPSLPVRPTAFVILTLFALYNMFGLKSAAKLQKILTVTLLGGLGIFILFGLTKADFAAISPVSNPNFLMNGVPGLISASFLLMYAVSQSGLMNFSRLAKDPKRTIPFAIAGTTCVLFVVYILMAVVSSSVLPVEVVANQPLTFVAKEILPYPIFIFFMIAGPIMALTTSLNASFIQFAEPLVAAIKDGWFSPKLAATNKRGAYWIIYLLIYLSMVVPILLGWDINMAANANLLVYAFVAILQFVALAVIPKKYPKAWANRIYGKKVPMWAFYLLIAVSVAIQIGLMWNSIISVEPYVVIATVIVIGIAIPYAIRKVKRGEVSTVDIEVEM